MKHIETSRLFTFAEGSLELEDKEREHLKRCEDCQEEVLSVFKTYVVDSSKKSQEEETFSRSKRFVRTKDEPAA
jgi:hypothetical protein